MCEVVLKGHCPPTIRVRCIPLPFQDDEGQTALHYSIGNDNVELTGILLESGADLFRHDDRGILPTALVKSTSMKSFLNDKIFDATMASECNQLSVCVCYQLSVCVCYQLVSVIS